ncbi:MAG: inner membrane-spanning protein YciB [Alphaproteobacteria bacterium]
MFEYLPLIGFAAAYYMYDMITATIVLVALSLVVVPVAWKKTGKPPYTHIFTAVLLSIFGGLTVFSGDTTFIKMKPTIASGVFAIILFSSNITKLNVLKRVMGGFMTMSDKSWNTLSNNTGIYFMIVAILNELVWRNFTESQWVQFKVFGLTGLYVLFILVHIPFFKRNTKFK